MTNKASPTPEAREAGRKVSSARADARAIEFAAVEWHNRGFRAPPSAKQNAGGKSGALAITWG